MTVLRITGFDHLVLRCSDVDTTLAWYLDLLGLEPVRVDEWRRGEAPFPSVRIDDDTIIDLVPGAADDGRLDHVCIVCEPIDLGALVESGEFDVIEGPVRRFGARGDGTSLYVRDPDGLVVEIRHY
jgi:catechol 2,3-dioxygenase-like lactoylglutathione lyase family enzyme